MTEQPPSAEAWEIADSQPLVEVLRVSLAHTIDALCEQRVSAAVREYTKVVETARAFMDSTDGNELDAERALFDAVEAIRAPAERPASEGPQQQDSLRGIGVEQRTQDTGQPGCGTRWRHKKRGSIETVLGEGSAQTDTEIKDGDHLLVYRDDNGRLWFRSPAEFLDGRFERLPDAPSALASTGEQPDCGWVLVPREPTPEMSEAAFQIEADGHSQRTLSEAAWRAMIAAAPVPQTGRVELGERSNTESSPDTTAAAISDACAKCGHPRREHSYNGACYGLCGEFVESVPSPAAVPDYTERARVDAFPTRIWSDEHGAYWRKGVAGYTQRASQAWVLPLAEARVRTAHCVPEKKIELEIAHDQMAALSAVASEHQAEIENLRAEREAALAQCREQRHRAQDEEAANMALLARLREPDDALVDAVAHALHRSINGPQAVWDGLRLGEMDWFRSHSRAALTKIAEMME